MSTIACSSIDHVLPVICICILCDRSSTQCTNAMYQLPSFLLLCWNRPAQPDLTWATRYLSIWLIIRLPGATTNNEQMSIGTQFIIHFKTRKNWLWYRRISMHPHNDSYTLEFGSYANLITTHILSHNNLNTTLSAWFAFFWTITLYLTTITIWSSCNFQLNNKFFDDLKLTCNLFDSYFFSLRVKYSIE